MGIWKANSNSRLLPGLSALSSAAHSAAASAADDPSTPTTTSAFRSMLTTTPRLVGEQPAYSPATAGRRGRDGNQGGCEWLALPACGRCHPIARTAALTAASAAS